MRSERFAAAMVAAMSMIAAAGRVDAQVEVGFGPFVGFTAGHGGKPTSVGLQATAVSGPIGVRVGGFSAIDEDPSVSSSTGEPRYGGDADLMLLFNLASRGSNSVGVAPYLFAGASLTVRDAAVEYGGFPYYNSRFVDGWSYGGGMLIPFGAAAQLMAEIRARPNDLIALNGGSASTRTEYRVGLSLRFGNLFGGRRRSAPNESRPRAPRPPSNDPIGVVLGSVGEVVGAAAPASAARVIPTAERYLGTPYRYGGTSPITGFDCSGFVQYVFARNNVKLPRTSRQQAKVGKAMPRRFKSLAAGDLVMFAERGEPISHVAIYAGHNRIIHATSSGGAVRYDDLGTRRGQWFVDHMVAARRVTPDARGLMLDLARLLDAKSLADTALDIGDLAPRP
jgi:hypothetical protein